MTSRSFRPIPRPHKPTFAGGTALAAAVALMISTAPIWAQSAPAAPPVPDTGEGHTPVAEGAGPAATDPATADAAEAIAQAEAEAEAEAQAQAEAEAEAQAQAEAQAAAQAAEDAAQAAAAAEAATAAVAACLDIAGQPTAETPISRAAQRTYFARLRAGEDACDTAARLAPDAGGPLFNLATLALIGRDHDRAVALYGRAAAAGVGPAHTRLGDYFNFGLGSVDTDIDRAIGHYRDAVAAGDPAGIATLAGMYRLGRGVPRDPGEMLRLFERAADRGYHFAQYQFAQILLTGEGIPDDIAAAAAIPDPARALGYLEGAAEAGNLQAALDLARAYGQGADGVAPDPVAQFRWTGRAAEAGAPQAIAARAFLFEQGIGTDPDPDRAARGYVAALDSGEIDPAAMRDFATARPPAWDGATARAFQVLLQERGLYDGAIDGIVGRGTLAGAAALAD